MKKRNSIIKVILLALVLMSSATLYAQDSTAEAAAAPTKELVKGTFEYSMIINNQTVETFSANSLNFIIQHRFGVIKNSDDLYGLFAPSNIRLGLDYGITKRLSVGVGATKNKMIYDLQWKYALLKQEKGGGMPVTVTYYGNLSRSAQDESNFINQDSVYKSANRISYFHELMVARKFNSKISVQAAFTYTHYNFVDSAKDQITDHDFLGYAFVARYKFSPQSSVLLDISGPLDPRPYVTSSTTTVDNTVTTDVVTKYYARQNLGLGYEVSTGSHQFQVFVTTADQITQQEMNVYNTNSISDKDIMIGFNITRSWGFK